MKVLFAGLILAAALPTMAAPQNTVKQLHCKGQSRELDTISLDVTVLSQGAKLTTIVARDAHGKADADIVNYLFASNQRESYGPFDSGVAALPIGYQGQFTATGYGDGQWVLNFSQDYQKAQLLYDDNDGALVVFDVRCQ